MALRTIVTTIDDLDDTAGAETVVFSFKETVYSVDRTARNQQELLRVLEPFITAGGPSRGSTPSSSHPNR